MLEVVKKLQSKDKHGIFAEPVTEAIAPGYFGVVDRPMDFRTLRDNVGLGKYQTWDGFAGDLELIYANAAAYNPRGRRCTSWRIRRPTRLGKSSRRRATPR